MKQHGDFGTDKREFKEIFYPVPYKTNPNLTIHSKNSANSEAQIFVTVQRPDGFVAGTAYGSDGWEWEAVGIPKDK